MTDPLNLRDIKDVRSALGRLPSGAAAVDLAARLGLWSGTSHAHVATRPEFPRNLAELSAEELSDQMALWTSELGRITEINGAVAGQRELVKMRLKSARSSARARVRREHEAPTVDAEGTRPAKLTVAQVNDLAEEDHYVLELDEQAALLEMLGAHARAAQEATAQYVATLSREISWRSARLSSRTYA